MPEISLNGSDWQLLHLMPSEWYSRKVWEEDFEPSAGSQPAGDWIRGTVPGDIISDSLEAGLIPDPYRDLNSRSCEWLTERDWVYRKRFSLPEELLGRAVRLKFSGVDSRCVVYLNGEKLGEHQGMFLPFEYNVTRLLKYDSPNTLVIVVFHKPPADEVQGQVGWTRAARTWKARFAYDWDFCTRLVPLGIWQRVSLVDTDEYWIENIHVKTNIENNRAEIAASIEFQSENWNSAKYILNLSVIDPASNTVCSRELSLSPDADRSVSVKFDIASPEYWFPNGSGGQPLYNLSARLLKNDGELSDHQETRFGIRNVDVLSNDGAPDDALPYTLEVNGKKAFIKGWNWVPIDNCYGRPDIKRYRRLLGLARHAGCNLLRVWGGGLLERDEFYDLCDEYGLMVWQEFMQSSSGIQNSPPEDEEYLEYIRDHAEKMIPLRRNHPCLVIWCGGNELFDDNGRPLDNRHPATGCLKEVVKSLDPDRVWLPTSPSGPEFIADSKAAGTGRMHDVHGQWLYLGPEEHYSFYNSIDPLFHSEFGAEGPANLHTLREFVSPEYEFPPDKSNPVWIHHGNWWINRDKVEDLFGKIDDIETFVRAGQWLQAEGLRYICEANRRRKWHCSGMIPWQFNEPFPNTSCTNAVDYLGFPKPAYWYVKRAYEPVHASLKYDKLAWSSGEKMQAELWINNSGAAIQDCSWLVSAYALDGREIYKEEGCTDLGDNESGKIKELSISFEETDGCIIVFADIRNGRNVLLSSNEYIFPVSPDKLKPLLDTGSVELEVTPEGNLIKVKNKSDAPALFVRIYSVDGQWITPDNDYFCVRPHNFVVLGIDGKRAVTVQAWNSNEYTITLTK